MIATPDTTDILRWALSYHARGWSIIPINPRTKKPGVPTWLPYQVERPTEQQVREWFSGKYKALAVVLGGVSGNLAALDLDSEERSQWWTQTHPDLGRTLPTERTTRGLHVLFTCEPVRTQRRVKEKVELLSRGSYLILTPSPGKRWLTPPNGEIPQIDPFSLGLEAFGIKKPQFNQKQFTEEGLTEDNQEIASVSSVSSVSSVNPDLKNGELRAQIDSAIKKTLPQEAGQRDRCIFTFCQWLKAIPEVRGRTAAELKSIVRRWHTTAYPVIGTKPFDDTWADFVYGWKRVKWRKGILLERAVQQAREDTQNPPEAQSYDDPRTQLLVRLCWQLQQSRGDQPFYLSLRTAGEILGVSHISAGKKLEMLMADGLLAIAAAHTNIFATRYKYIGEHGVSQ